MQASFKLTMLISLAITLAACVLAQSGNVGAIQPSHPPKKDKRQNGSIGAIQPFHPAPPKRRLETKKRASVCNGDASLCSRLYSNLTYIGAHNSYAVGSISSAGIGNNQAKNVETQLNDGIRMLQAQGHQSSNSTGGSGIDLCHSSCELVNGGTLESYLTTVKTWVDANPNQVLTLLFVNSDDLPVSRWATAFQSTGLAEKVYQPSSAATFKNSWPTLGSMIDSGRNLVVFIDNSADTSTVPYILPEFQNMWENPYNQVSVPFDCSVNRIDSGAWAEDFMYLTNHYLDNQSNLFGTTVFTPNTAEITTTNGVESIIDASDTCASTHASYPTFILVDFYDQGDGSVFKAAAQMNGVQYTGNVKAAQNTTSGADSSSNIPRDV